MFKFLGSKKLKIIHHNIFYRVAMLFFTFVQYKTMTVYNFSVSLVFINCYSKT